MKAVGSVPFYRRAPAVFLSVCLWSSHGHWKLSSWSGFWSSPSNPSPARSLRSPFNLPAWETSAPRPGITHFLGGSHLCQKHIRTGPALTPHRKGSLPCDPRPWPAVNAEHSAKCGPDAFRAPCGQGFCVLTMFLGSEIWVSQVSDRPSRPFALTIAESVRSPSGLPSHPWSSGTASEFCYSEHP